MKTMNNAVLGVMLATTAFVAGCALRGESGNTANAARTTKANAMNKNTTGHYASVNSLKMYYEIQGATDGKNPLVLLHGGGSTIETSFGSVLSSFAKTRQVIAFEQQGHGHTADVLDRPFTSFQRGPVKGLRLG